MFLIYDFIFLIIALVYLPVYLFRRKFHRGFLLRLGVLPEGLKLGRPVWIHAVSVGEAMAVRGLAEELRKIYPQKKLVISTVTPTGNKIAKGLAREGDFITYLPLDFSFVVKKVIEKINPSVFIIAETELWPNLIGCLRKKNIPVIVVNARISTNSFRGYCSIKYLIRPILNRINLFCAQADIDAERLVSLGVMQGKVKVTGNMKFDAGGYVDLKKDYSGYRRNLGLGIKEKLFVAASTHSGEEEIILTVYKKLLREFPYLRLLLAPRHPGRTPEVERLVIKYGFNPIRVSQLASSPVNQLNRQTGKPANRQTIFILDTIGQLLNYYAIADIVFVGGSLVKSGGHNILEPAALAKPILFGPYVFNFRDITDLFLANNAARLARNPEELEVNIAYLLNNPGTAAKLAECARELILSNQGATKKNIEFIIQEERLCSGRHSGQH